MFTLLYLIYLGLLGFLINYIMFDLVLSGILGYSLQEKLLGKIREKDSIWFDRLLIRSYMLIILLLLFIYYRDIIYLEEFVINVENLKVVLTGEGVRELTYLLGGTGAFITGSKIGYSAISKYPIGFIGKTAISGTTGVGFTFGWKLAMVGSQYISGSAKYNVVNEKAVTIEVNDVKISKSVIDSLGDSDSISVSSLIKANESYNAKLPGFTNIQNYKYKLIENLGIDSTEKKSQIIELIEQKREISLSEIFKDNISPLKDQVLINDNNNNIVANTFINSPLESGELSLMVKNQLIELLTYELIIHFIMTYLIFMLIFIFTIKVVIDHNISLENIKHMRPLWLGNIIYNIIIKLINLWRKSNIFWIYFISISIFMFSLVTTFGLYACLVLLS